MRHGSQHRRRVESIAIATVGRQSPFQHSRVCAIARTRAALSDESVRLTEAGFLAGAGALRTSLRYGLGSGVDVAIEVEPIVLVMPTLPPARR